MIKGQIEAAVKKALIAIGAPDVLPVVERPSDMSHGDYATPAALTAAKVLKKSPRDVAEMLQAELLKKEILPEIIESVEIAGAGFINFTLSRAALAQELFNASQNPDWGKNNLYENKVVMVEYTDPNPFKEFHIGHLMSNAIGEAIARVLEASGAEVKRANYQGDVGLHVAKTVWNARQLKNPAFGDHVTGLIFQLGLAYQAGSLAYEKGGEEKKEIDDLNKLIYEIVIEKKHQNSDIKKIYDIGKEVSLAHFEEIYKVLGTKFDEYFFESETGPKGVEIVHAHPEVFEKSEGATVFHGEKYGLHTRVFLNKLGLPTYEAKDLGLLELKQKTAAVDESITITANEQNEYFKVVLEAAKHIPELQDFAERTKHVSHGMMRFASSKMSSRLGNVVTGESLLEELTDQSKEKMTGRNIADTDKVAEQVAVGAIKYAVLKQGSGRDIIFDPQKSLSLEGDSGPYLQYAHTRALSLLRAAREADITPDTTDAPDGAGILERMLVHYPEVVARAAYELEPHYITTYLTELAAAFNSWYAGGRVIGGKHEHWGVLLTQAVEQTLAKGLAVLGIPAPEQM